MEKKDKSTFSPDLVIKEAREVLNNLEHPESKGYYELAKMLLNFRHAVRIKAVETISQVFSLNESRLLKDLRGLESDEADERDMLARREFTLYEYVDLISKRRKEYPHDKWSSYDGKDYSDPRDVQLACIYDMLRHLMWKAANCRHDISAAGFIEDAWEKAVEEIELRNETAKT